MRIERLLAMTVLLLSRRSVTAKQLSERFGIAIRTVYRDVETLVAAGIPIVSIQGSGGGYSLMEDYRIDRRMLSNDEMSSILSAFRGLNATIPHESFERIIDTFDGLSESTDQSGISRKPREYFTLDLAPWGAGTKFRSSLNDLHRAVRENRVVCFTYRDRNGAQSTRTIEPLRLICKSFIWYLHGYCRTRSDFRLFRLSRTRDINVRPETFTPREIPDDKNDFESQWNAVPADLVLRFSPRKRLHVEEYFPEEDIQYLPDGSLRVKVGIPEDDWVYGMILSYGSDVEVLEPERIRRSIAEHAKNIQKLYET